MDERVPFLELDRCQCWTVDGELHATVDAPF